MFIGSVETVVVAITFPRSMDTVLILAAKLALVAFLLLCLAEIGRLIFSSGTSDIRVTKPSLGNAFVFRLGETSIRETVEFLIGACPVAATVSGRTLIGSIPTIVFAIADKGSRNALSVVTLEKKHKSFLNVLYLEDIVSDTDLLSTRVCTVGMSFVPAI